MQGADAVAATLRDLAIGERAWFWFTTAVDEVFTPFMVSPIASDPMMGRLETWIESTWFPVDAPWCVGVLAVGEDGRIQLGARDAEEPMLGALAAWCGEKAADAPDLARLADASFVKIDDEQIVVAHFSDPSLWEGLSRPTPSGGREEARQILASLQAGQSAAFWATSTGPGGEPFLGLLPPGEQDRFAEQLATWVLRCEQPPDGVRGLLRALPSGTLIAVSESPAESVAEHLAAIAELDGFGRLFGSAALMMQDGRYVEGASVTRGGE